MDSYIHGYTFHVTRVNLVRSPRRNRYSNAVQPRLYNISSVKLQQKGIGTNMNPMQAAAAAGQFVGPTNVVGSEEGEVAAQQAQLSASSPAQPQSGAPTAGPQHTTQGQMAGAKPTPDPEKCRIIQEQLELLLHAHKCQRYESQANGEMRQCTLPDCKTMKNVLNHMTNCQVLKKCTVPHCSMSRLIISHWKHCKQSDCPVCSPIRQARNRKNSVRAPTILSNNPKDQPNFSPFEMKKAYEALGIQYPITPGLLPSQDFEASVGMSALSMASAPPGTLSNVGLAQFQTQRQHVSEQSVVFAGLRIPNVSLPLKSEPSTVGVASNQMVSMTGSTFSDAADAVDIQDVLNRLEDLQLSSGPQSGQITATPVRRTKEWHLSPFYRSNILRKMIRAMFSNIESISQSVLDERLPECIHAFARRSEGDIYKTANSQSEYYHLLAEKICEIRKKRENHRRNTATVAAASGGCEGRRLVEYGLDFHKTQLTKMKSFTKYE